MAVVEIDRHILLEITMLIEKRKVLFSDFSNKWSIIHDVVDKTEMLLDEPDSDTKTSNFTSLRKKIVPAVKKTQQIISDISVVSAKEDALLKHLVSLVLEVDTNKGQETKEKEKEN